MTRLPNPVCESLIYYFNIFYMKHTVFACLYVLLLNICSTAQNTNTRVGTNALQYNVSGNYNVAIGNESMRLNRSGSYNTAVGSTSLYGIQSGSFNVAMGYNALSLASTGSFNTAIGSYTLLSNNGNYNTAIGHQSAMNASFDVSQITAVGYSALQNTRASFNTAIGVQTLANNTSGTNNTAVGDRSLYGNTTGSGNTAIGDSAGARFTFNNATFVGYQAAASVTGLSNITVLGYRALATASNQVRIGNSSVVSIGGRVAWSTLSDGRFKEQVKEDVPGLAFINQLRPVTYVIDRQKFNRLRGIADESPEENTVKEKRQTGLIAQEVHNAARALNFEFSGVDAPQNNNDFYSLRYAEFVVPLVKAVQELNGELETLKEIPAQLEIQEKKLSELEHRLAMLQNKAWMKQNMPNPVSSNTSVEYFIPSNVKRAYIAVTNAKGQQLKTYSVNGSGRIIFDAALYPAGTYQFTLVCNGQTITSRQFIVAH